MLDVIIIVCYLGILIGLGIFSQRFFRGTAADYFVASHSIGPVLLLMSIFGTTMTAFAMIGSTGEAYDTGIGVYGMMASWSGLVHSAVFFIVGIKIWALGKKNGYMTQVQFFRDRFESVSIGYLLFPVVVGLVIPYLLVGIMGAGSVIRELTVGDFPTLFPATNGSIPNWLSEFVISAVVLAYIFMGGLRAAAWANAFQTVVFMVMGAITFWIIGHKLGGFSAATQMAEPTKLVREGNVSQMHFLTYFFVPLSVGMFPHLFQHWLTAKSAKTFRLTVICHPLFIMIVWVPCILIGIWASGAVIPGADGTLQRVVPEGTRANAVLGMMVSKLAPGVLAGFLTAGVLAAIMSSLDSQFMCLGTIFTNDIVLHHYGKKRFTEKQVILMSRVFIVLIVIVTYLLSLFEHRRVFTLGVWCFSGFSGLFPLIFTALYWKRVTSVAAHACVIVTTALWCYLFYDSGYGLNTDYLVFGVTPVAVIVVASALTIFLVSLVSTPPSEQTLNKFFKPLEEEKVSMSIDIPEQEEQPQKVGAGV